MQFISRLCNFRFDSRKNDPTCFIEMNLYSPINTTASSLPAGKITRKQLAAYCGLSVRTIDELTRSGVLAHFKIGKSIRYDLAEAETALRERFHVGARTEGGGRVDERRETPDGGLRTSRSTSRPARADAERGRAGCPQPAAPEPTTAETETALRERFHVGARTEGGRRVDERRETPDGGLRRSRPASRPARADAERGRAGCPQPAASEPTTAEAETALRERFHVGAKVPAQPQPGQETRASSPAA
jgi:helix-turn-helix protein